MKFSQCALFIVRLYVKSLLCCQTQRSVPRVWQYFLHVIVLFENFSVAELHMLRSPQIERTIKRFELCSVVFMNEVTPFRESSVGIQGSLVASTTIFRSRRRLIQEDNIWV